MRILIVTTFFYPQNVIAVSRLGQWAKYLAKEGNEVTVLTTKKYPFWPLDNHVPLPDGVHVIEVDYLPWIFKRMFGIGSVSKSDQVVLKKSNLLVRRVLEFLRRNINKYLDPHDFWIPEATKVGLGLARENFDLMISSYSSAASHHVAKNIKIKYPTLKWMADFRDLWSENHLSNYGPFFACFNRVRERSCIKHADMITTVSEPLGEVLKASYPEKKVCVIENGFDPEDYEYLPSADSCTRACTKPFTIVYTGMIYKGKRDPTPLLMAVNNLIDSNVLDPSDIHVAFYGPSENILNELISAGNYNKNGVISIHGQVPRDQSLKIQRESDVLLFLEWNDPSAKGVLTGKLFEYLASGTFILALGINPDSSAGQLIEQSGTGVVAADVDEIEALLLQVIGGGFGRLFKPDWNVIDMYSRDNQVRKMLRMVSEG